MSQGKKHNAFLGKTSKTTAHVMYTVSSKAVDCAVFGK